MSRQAIGRYLNHLADIRRASGTNRESAVSEAFKDLLKECARAHDLIFLNQYELPRQAGDRRIIDGALVYDLRLPFGYWEAKDEADDLDAEIAAKFRRGYPRDNIIFEDSRSAVLIQNGNEVTRCAVDDVDALERLLGFFFAYERPEIAQFRKAVAQFQQDLPAVLDALREMIERAQTSNAPFRRAAAKFLKHAQETINPAVTADDVREMLIQHILTEEIFAKVFDEDDFHRQNNVARELYGLEEKFFTGALKKNTLKGLEPYYNAIRATAHQIRTHGEKQTFLKVIYENFYKVYNRKAADRLGVVYTPQEIVRFMVESADWLCQKHFGKSLIDRGVEILDPATGTGTFICELLEHFRGQKSKLAHKYKEELHANEVAILPYYVANLNIEATYAAITGQYAEFPNLCFVDTLDNVAGLGIRSGHQHDLFGAMSEENVARIRRQNGRKISVVIGNPPYNANQQNENDNNKNRAYAEIDRRIKESYIRLSNAHKTKTYDMYARFVRWASDRLDDSGIVAFITNRSFIDKRAFDGFRKALALDFSEIYIVDLGGDARDSITSSKGNLFGIRVGVAIMFLVRSGKKPCEKINVCCAPPGTRAEQLAFLGSSKLNELVFSPVSPDARGGWSVQHEENLEGLPLTLPKLSGRNPGDRHAIFNIASFGAVSNRDDWVYDRSRKSLCEKVRFYIDTYNDQIKRLPQQLPDDWESKLDYRIKWTQDLRRNAAARKNLNFDANFLVTSLYRPFSQRYYYSDPALSWSLYRMPWVFPNPQTKNSAIFFSDRGARAPFSVIASSLIGELHLCASTDGFQCVPLYEYATHHRTDNITDWALNKFIAHYGKHGARPSPVTTGERSPAKRGRMRAGGPDETIQTEPAEAPSSGLRAPSPATREKDHATRKREITKDAIFHYVYAVLHDPLYREKYAQNLKREFPRIPFYADFWRWADWGARLMALHIGYENVEPWPLRRIDAPDEKSRAAKLAPKVVLRSDHATGVITLDSETQLTGVPKEAWDYRLGNRTALDWILDQHKEKTPKDPTIREKFNTYRFKDHKEKVVDLILRVTRVSVETMEIVNAMRATLR